MTVEFVDDGVVRRGLPAERLRPSSGGVAEEEWLHEGHELLGQRVARIFLGKRDEERVALGTIVKWVPADEAAGDEARFRCFPNTATTLRV